MARPFAGKVYNCKNCGIVFKRSQSEIARGRVSYCSNKCSGMAHSGVNNPSYKRGYFINENGYKKVRVDGKYKYEHRYLVEQTLDRKLRPTEDVHHINGDKLDNRIENLKVLTKSEHTRLHGNWIGDKNHTTKLDETKVRSIRKSHADGITSKELASIYNVDVSNIRYIVNRATWRHVT